MIITTKALGWKKDSLDHRDCKLEHQPDKLPVPSKLPSEVDLRATCPPVYNQGQLGSCHDSITEVLTIRGWKKFSEITEDTYLASVCPETGEMIYEKPARIVQFQYAGLMTYCKHQHLDFAVTQDHKMLVRKWNEKNRSLDKDFGLVSAKDLGWYFGLPSTVNPPGNGISQYVIKGVESKFPYQTEDLTVAMEDWVSLLGIFLAEGTVLKEGYKIQLAASKDREKTFIRELLNKLDIKSCELTDRFTFENKRIHSALEQYGYLGIKAPTKFVPDFVFGLDRKYIKAFLNAHRQGDGSIEDGYMCHYTSSEKLADQLQLLIFLSGDLSSISIREPRESVMQDGRVIKGNFPGHRISVRERGQLSIEKKKHIHTEEYTGIVYCAEVPTYHTLVTRRNKKILISGNCTGNAIAGAMEFDMKRQHLTSIMPSRLFIYYNERVLENDVKLDNGAEIRDGLKTVARQGACNELLWPYDITKFASKPTAAAYKDGLSHLATSYATVTQTSLGLRSCLASGLPIVFGFSVFQSFMSDQVALDGLVPMPSADDAPIGGHAVLCVGYSDTKQSFLVRNSWGASWGVAGYFWLNYQYVLNPDLASDFWVIRVMGH